MCRHHAEYVEQVRREVYALLGDIKGDGDPSAGGVRGVQEGLAALRRALREQAATLQRERASASLEQEEDRGAVRAELAVARREVADLQETRDKLARKLAKRDGKLKDVCTSLF